MLTYLCENCGSKFRALVNRIDHPCLNMVNSIQCGFPLKPILSMRIEGIEKEKDLFVDFDTEILPHIDCSGLSDSDIDQLRKVLKARNE